MNPAPATLSAEFIGMLVVGIIFLTRWLWDYNRSRREETQQHEPRANPPLHKEYVTKADYTKESDELKAELKRHAARRAEIYDGQKVQSEKLARLEVASERQGADLAALKTEMGDLQTRVTEIPERTISLLIDAQKIAAKR